jgi:hypothetical protein
MKVVDRCPSAPGVDEEEMENCTGKASGERAIMMAMPRVAVTSGDASVQSDFPAPRAHPIDAVLESRSWMDDVVSSGSRTDDDELRRETERIKAAERQLFQEMQLATEILRIDLSEDWHDRSSENQNSPIDVQLIERDSIDSPQSSQPSDEACNGEDTMEPEVVEGSVISLFMGKKSILGNMQESLLHEQNPSVRGRDPPESFPPAVVSTHRRNENADDVLSGSSSFSDRNRSVYGDPSVALSACKIEDSVGCETAELPLTNRNLSRDTDDFDGERDHGPSTMSDWEIKAALATPDLENGISKDVFEEETFWDDSFWKTCLDSPEQERGDPTDDGTLMGKQERTVPAPLEDKKVQGHKPHNLVEEIDFAIESRNSYSKGWERHSGHSSAEGEWPGVWRFSSRVQWKAPERSFQDTKESDSISSEGTEDSSATGNDVGSKLSRCRFRRSVIIVGVHLFLLIAGLIVMVQFLKTSEEVRYQSHPPPENKECRASMEHSLSVNSTVQGTLLGATSDQIPCHESEHPMVWYNFAGTGGPIVASTSEETTKIYLSVLSGQCGELDCIGSSKSSSVAWMSSPEEIYQLLIHAESPRGNFFLQIAETTTNNLACEKSTMIAIPINGGNFSIRGSTDSTISTNATITCHFVSDVGAGAWFSFLGNGNYTTVSICNGSRSVGETQLRLFSGQCSELKCVAEQENSSAAVDSRTSISWISKHDQIYHIMVSNGDTNQIEFELCIQQSKAGVSCESSIPTVVFAAGDSRNDSFGSIEEPQTGIIMSNQSAAGKCIGDMKSGIWYSVVGTGYPMSTPICGNIGTVDNAIFYVLTGSCDGLECINNGTSANCGASAQHYLSWDTVLGKQYWILVSPNFVQDHGSFTLEVQGFGGAEELDEKSRDSAHKISGSVWIGLMLGGLFGAFVLIAWRWRRLKRTNQESP